MAKYMVDLPLEAAYFYEKVAQMSGRRVEQVLSDALFKLAGELSLEALYQKAREDGEN